MNDINAVTLVGRLTRDAEVKTLPSGTDLAEMSIASNYSVKRGDQWEEEVSYFAATKFKPGGLAKYLTKGTQVAVKGELRQERWEKDGQKRSRVRIHAEVVQLLGSKGGAKPAQQQEAFGSQPGDRDFDDDVPF